MFDAGAHVLAGEFAEVPDEYREIPTRLAGHGILSASTSGRLDSRAGFRNLLVHRYADVDVERLHAALGRLDDLEAFVVDVETWLQAAGR